MDKLSQKFEEAKHAYQQKNYSKAIEIAKNIIAENEKAFPKAYVIIADSYFKTKKENESITYCDKAINFGFADENIYIIKALILFGLSRYEQVFENIDLAIAKGYPRKKALVFKAYCFVGLKDLNNAAKLLLESGLSDLEIFSLFKDYQLLISKMLDLAVTKGDNTNFFKQALQKDEKLSVKGRCNKYKDLYISILELTYTLYVSRDEEKNVAHYTQKETLEKLLFEDSPLRMSTVVTANDPQEGYVLFEYLGLCDNVLKYRNTNYQSFIGSFTFNHDCLNQFRLYGKKENKEATGVSFVVKQDFFNKGVKSSNNNTMAKGAIVESVEESKKQALYRCIYIDPETKEVISIGQREIYTFYRENQNKKGTPDYKEEKALNEYINAYQKYISDKLSDVKDKMKNLKNKIEKNKGLKHEVIAELLMMLRYLTKHMAFKEEQECRILSIEPLMDNDAIKPEKDEKIYSQMYIEYLPIKDYVKNIYFAPKTQGQGMFKDQLKRYGIECGCWKSKHPFA